MHRCASCDTYFPGKPGAPCHLVDTTLSIVTIQLYTILLFLIIILAPSAI